MERLIGVIKYLDREKGFGFILRENRSDLYFHETRCLTSFSDLVRGQHVTYRLGTRGERVVGVDVQVVKLPPYNPID